MHTLFYRTGLIVGLAAIGAAGAVAQTQETKTTTTTKTEIRGGKNATVIGCLERRTNGDYVLAETRDIKSANQEVRYMLVTNTDLSKHVGERVQISGKSAASDRGKVSVESKAETGKDHETKTKTTGTTGQLDMPLLSVTSIKTIGSTCS